MPIVRITGSEGDELPPVLKAAIAPFCTAFSPPDKARVISMVKHYARLVNLSKASAKDLISVALSFAARLSLWRGVKARYWPGWELKEFSVSYWVDESDYVVHYHYHALTGPARTTDAQLKVRDHQRRLNMVKRVFSQACLKAGLNPDLFSISLLLSTGSMCVDELTGAYSTHYPRTGIERVFLLNLPSNYLHCVSRLPVLPYLVPIYHDPKSLAYDRRDKVAMLDGHGHVSVMSVHDLLHHEDARR